MNLLMDVGNTAIKICQVDANGSIHHLRRERLQDCKYVLQQIAADRPEIVVIGATAPDHKVCELSRILNDAGISVRHLKKTGSLPFVSRYAPGEAGIDRLANVAATVNIGISSAIIIDAGTAITVEVVNENEFAGGVIMPGLHMQIHSLFQGTGHLPLITLEPGPDSFATNTVDAIKVGVVNGSAYALHGMLDRICSEISTQPKVIITGGDAALLQPLLHWESELIPDLTFRGIALLAKHNNLI